MGIEEILAFLTQRGVTAQVADIPYGKQVRCPGGEIIAVYDSGKSVIQGKHTPLRDELAVLINPVDPSGMTGDAGAAATPGLNKQVFVVYGHDEQARKDLELLLLRMGLKPIVLAYLTPKGDTIIEKLERELVENPQVRFACVLLTPDDEGYPVGKPDDVKPRARQNVILELGMVIGHLGRARVAIFHKESVELPSDILGLLYIPFKDRVDEQANQLFRILDEAGYQPETDGL